MTVVLLVLLVLVIAVVLVRFAQVAGRPEDAATHPEDLPEDTTSERFYRGADRPGGPDAEDPVHPDDSP
jgi:Na+-transporting methylmalonyl-CoA/oxaloacetate decarboxylase gamma subunit